MALFVLKTNQNQTLYWIVHPGPYNIKVNTQNVQDYQHKGMVCWTAVLHNSGSNMIVPGKKITYIMHRSKSVHYRSI